jgi:hypothetical protein
MTLPKEIWGLILDKLRPIDYYHILLASKIFYPINITRHVEMMKNRYYETRNAKLFDLIHPYDPYWLPFSYRCDISKSFSLRPAYTKISTMVHRYWCSTHSKTFIIKERIGFGFFDTCCKCCSGRFEDIKLTGWNEPLLIEN